MPTVDITCAGNAEQETLESENGINKRFTKLSQVKLSKTKVTLKVKKTANIKAIAVVQSSKLKMKKHRAIQFESSDPSIATVTKSGKIKGIKKGKCTIYAYAQNGVMKAVKVVVK